MTETRYTQGYCERAAVTESGPLRFVAATEGAKGDGINLRMDGARLDRFRSSPVVLWGHDYSSVPIGRADVQVTGNRLMADITFDQSDEFARKIDKKYRDGFLNAVSIGFDFSRIERDGTVEDWQLLEISAVPVPMDPDALLARQRTALRSLGESLASVLDEEDEETRDANAIADLIRETIVSEFAKLSLPQPVTEDVQPEIVPEDDGLDPNAVAELLAALKLENK